MNFKTHKYKRKAVNPDTFIYTLLSLHGCDTHHPTILHIYMFAISIYTMGEVRKGIFQRT